jgi:argininosuccinate synthase
MSTIVLAYSGGRASSNAIQWLARKHAADVVTVTLDVGQGEDLAALRARALSYGAVRAHAIDARDELVREFLLPTLSRGPLGDGVYPPIDAFTRPLIARTLLEVARIEGTSVVAHASPDESIDAPLRALNPSVTILAPARDSSMDPHSSAHRVEQTLWGRMISVRDGDNRPDEARPSVIEASTEPAHLDIRFENGVPVTVNDVPMPPVELVESLTLIAGRHGVGHLESRSDGCTLVYDAPAAAVLHAARAALGEPTGVVRLSVLNGTCTVLDLKTEVVNLA